MWSKIVLAVVTIATLGGLVTAQGTVICTYELLPGNIYSCTLNNQNIQSEVDMANVGGTHVVGQDDSHVTLLFIGTGTVVRVFPSLIINRFENLNLMLINRASMVTFGSPITYCANLEAVLIDTNQITTIPAGIFHNCARLQVLSMFDNEVINIQPNAFAGLWSLRSLQLSRNNITTLNSALFAPLMSLETLDLNTNQIVELPPGVFQYLSRLTTLNLLNNQITSWNSAILDSNRNLQDVRLAFNQIRTLEANTFSNLPNLTSLSVGELIETIPTFTTMQNLETLTLSFNNIQTVRAESFQNLPNLQVLRLGNNQITSVDFTARPSNFLQQLTELSIRFNQLTSIQDNAFSMLVNLNELDLERNQVERLNTNSIRPITQLRSLNLNQNRMRRIERGMFDGVTMLNVSATGNICINSNLVINNDFEARIVPLLKECFSGAVANKISVAGLIFTVIITLITKM